MASQGRESQRDPGTKYLWLAAGATAVALAARLPFFNKRSPDYDGWISGWIRHLDREGFSAFGDKFADYAPSYLYLLWLTTFSPISALWTVKLISITFELGLAVACAWVLLSLGATRGQALLGFCLVFALPTVVLNGAAWGQSDAVYAAFAVAAIAWAVRGKGAMAMLFAGVGIAVKAQGLLILPFLLLLTLRGRFNWKAWAWLQLPYVLAIIPGVILGRGLRESLTIYLDQADAYTKLTLSAPTVYAWLDLRHSAGQPGTYVAGVIVLGAVIATARWAKLRTPAEVLGAAAFFFVLAPFVLPKMHDRYFFLADVTTVLYAIARPQRWFVPVLVVGASLSVYLDYLYDIEPFPLEVAAAIMAAALVTLTLDVFPELQAVVRRAGARLGIGRLARFASIGLACTVMFAILYPLFRRELGPLESNAAALAITMVFNFLANRSWTFRAQRRSLLREAPGYLTAYLIGLGISSLALHAALSIVEAPSGAVETLIALAAGATATITRFALLTSFVYTPLQKPGPA
jgi:Gpi18-like mannosyltransferase/putative flippase GtrA